MIRVACIGSRQISPEQQDLFFQIGAWIVSQDHYISSGNAFGADEWFAKGGNSIKPKNVIIYLPWATYNSHNLHKDNKVLDKADNEWVELTSKFHPVWSKLSQGTRMLMARNWGIIHRADKVIALLNHNKQSFGGTGQGWRIAEHLNIPRLDLNGKSFEEVIEFIRS